MKIYLCCNGLDDKLKDAWKLHCGDFEFVTITVQNIIDLDVKAIVAPANSFGDMTGGLDLHYKNYLGSNIEKDIQTILAEKYYGELPVGSAEGVEIKCNNPNIKIEYVIFAPTMRVPETIGHTVNSFLAAKAAIIEAKRLELASIALPGLGTGTGGMDNFDCARQVAEAIKYVLIDKTYLEKPKDLYKEQGLTRRMAPLKWRELHGF